MNRETCNHLLEQIHDVATGLQAVKIMEVCGTHTVSLFRSGARSLLPANVELLSGPGCPVCVTSQAYIDVAGEIASRPNVIVCTYGDMLRVPGRNGSLESRRADGAAIHVVYSARDALRMAVRNPDQTIVFLAVGFETTAPATAAAIAEAEELALDNFLVLTAHKLVVPAMEILLSAGQVTIDGFLCPGHVSVVIGSHAYWPVVEKYQKPCVVAGFEPPNMLAGILALLRQIRAGEARLENVYTVAVSEQGNRVARRMLDETFVTVSTTWRAMGELPGSGLELSPRFAQFDALKRFAMSYGPDYEPPGCLCGQVIQARVKPNECILFGTVCTPAAPIGPCMVSSEGTCAAWYKYHHPAACA